MPHKSHAEPARIRRSFLIACGIFSNAEVVTLPWRAATAGKHHRLNVVVDATSTLPLCVFSVYLYVVSLVGVLIYVSVSLLLILLIYVGIYASMPYASIHLSIYLSVHLSIDQYIRIYIYVNIYVYSYICFYIKFVRLPICLIDELKT